MCRQVSEFMHDSGVDIDSESDSKPKQIKCFYSRTETKQDSLSHTLYVNLRSEWAVIWWPCGNKSQGLSRSRHDWRRDAQLFFAKCSLRGASGLLSLGATTHFAKNGTVS